MARRRASGSPQTGAPGLWPGRAGRALILLAVLLLAGAIRPAPSAAAVPIPATPLVAAPRIMTANQRVTGASVSQSANPSALTDPALLYGVYPGGGTGETPNAPQPDSAAVLQRLRVLAGDQPLAVHLYTAWSWYDPTDLDAQIAAYRQAGLSVVLTVKYSPPAGHLGDVAGFAAFVRTVVDRYAPEPALTALVIGNEANVGGNPSASDGAYPGATSAVVQGAVAARDEVARVGASTRIGVNFAVTDQHADAAFLQGLVAQGGSAFTGAVQFVGIDVYPGLWPAGAGDPGQQARDDLAGARASVDAVAAWRDLPLAILEIGAPAPSEAAQADRLTAFVQAVQALHAPLRISSFFWFDLWDANSQSANPFDHYGLLRTDLSPKPAFDRFRQAISAQQ